jgi:transcriptional regulator GlxA family with amidase domain
MVPGGMGTRIQVKNANLLKWIANKPTRTRLTGSVCTGSSLLGKAELLDGHEATTHWHAFDFLRQAAPNANIRKDLQFTIDGPIFTSAGIAAGIDMALHIVSYFFGTKVGEATAHQMEYPYPQNNKRSRNIAEQCM